MDRRRHLQGPPIFLQEISVPAGETSREDLLLCQYINRRVSEPFLFPDRYDVLKESHRHTSAFETSPRFLRPGFEIVHKVSYLPRERDTIRCRMPQGVTTHSSDPGSEGRGALTCSEKLGGFSLRNLAIGVSVFCTVPARMWSHRDFSSSSASFRSVAPSYRICWSLVLKATSFWIAAKRNWSLLCVSSLT